jgi:spermidine synthase
LRKFLPPVLLGFLATSFQIYLLREFSVHFYGNEMTYGIVLGSWLLWGGLGSIFASRRRIPASWFRPLFLGVVILYPAALAALRLSRLVLHRLPGEITGLSLIAPFALGSAFLVNFPLGVLFVLAVSADRGNIGRVWTGEALGAALGGLAVSLGLIPCFSDWQGVAVAGGLAALATLALPRAGRAVPGVALSLLAAGGLWLFDFPSQRLYWKPFPLLASRDTPYDRLQVIKLKEQVSLYGSGLPLSASGDSAAAEESVHFAFLQRPSARRALLIGGAAGGLSEALKYPGIEVDDVELDPEIVRLSLRHLPPYQRSGLLHPRAHILYRDGRDYLRSVRTRFDLIVLELPEPANALVNRFYTREFFRLARDRLTDSGVLSFRVPSSENYISPERLRFLGSLYQTLEAVFPTVAVVPGEANIFLASPGGLTLDADILSARVERLGLETVYVRREYLAVRLDRLRVSLLQDKLSGAPVALNSDLAPLSYFFDTILWNAQFRGVEAKVLTALSRLPRVWLLGLPLGLALLGLILLPGRKPSVILSPLVLLGFTTIVAEVMLLVWFQTLHGSVYGRLALLVAMFMAGLFLGALLGKGEGRVRPGRVFRLQAGIVLWLSILWGALRLRLPEPGFYLFLLGLGMLGGGQFMAANRLFLSRKADYGLGYGLELLGSFLGASAAASVFIPLAGLPGLALFLLALNGLGLVILLFKIKV